MTTLFHFLDPFALRVDEFVLLMSKWLPFGSPLKQFSTFPLFSVLLIAFVLLITFGDRKRSLIQKEED